jgi:hypothetical protein
LDKDAPPLQQRPSMGRSFSFDNLVGADEQRSRWRRACSEALRRSPIR